MFQSVAKLLARLPVYAVFGFSVLGTALIALVDLRTGLEISVAALYLAPIAAATWRCGRWVGAGVAGLACLAWLACDVYAGQVYSHPAIMVWNALARLGFYLITALLLASLRDQLDAANRRAGLDVLTGLWNVRAFYERLEHDLALARRRRGPLSVAYLDLDDFKRVNDLRGHAGGDEVLQELARRLEGALRASDGAGRLGGDEFAISLPDTDEAGARRVIERLRTALASLPEPLACSFGVATFEEPPASADAALQAADRLMYQAKARGKATAVFETIGLPAVELTPAGAERRSPAR
jgi:diguanylate cyclase (GGDEF)-like protein